MKCPCEIIKDLLPLYIDDVCSEKSKIAIQNHLPECEECYKFFEAMKSGESYEEAINDNLEDIKMADSLKKLKSKINRKHKIIIACSIIAIMLFSSTFYVLATQPIKDIPLEDIKVAVNTYDLDEISSTKVENEADEDVVSIGIYEGEDGELKLDIPVMPNAEVYVSENAIKTISKVSAVTFSSPYSIRTVEYADKAGENTLYIKGFKTTVLNNQESLFQTQQTLEFKEVKKVVFVADGQEKILWSE